MRKEIENNERIESYLKGALPEKEKHLFEQHMREDASFAQQVELYRQLHQVITDSVYLDVKNELKNIHLKKIQISKTIKRIIGFGSAGLIVGLVLLQLINKGNDTEAPAEEGIAAPTLQLPVSPLSDSLPDPDSTIRIQENHASPDESIISDIETGTADSVIHVPALQHDPGETENGGVETAVETGRDKQDTFIPQMEPQVEVLSDDPVSEPVETFTIDCGKVTITAIFDSNISCNNEPTGSIMVDSQSVTGGQPPYAFSLNKNTFTDTSMFASLYPGNYTVYAKDANDCISLLGTAIIGSEDCTYQAVFAPLRGETWTVPVNEDGTGMLIIYSKTGNVVYSIPVTGSETIEWRGETLSGQGLPMGLYQFEIRYDDGNSFIGNVTIVR